MINLEVRSETGTVEARARHGLVWGPKLSGLNRPVFPMLGHVVPYADTIFNSHQVSTLLKEVPRLPPGVMTDEFTHELVDLSEKVLKGTHLYLWFVGD
jgi:hypothetical protein